MMKKFIYLLILTISVISCQSNNDDDNTQTDSDPIIGKWQLHSFLENGTDSSTACEKKSTLLFSEKGTTIVVGFEDDGTGCVSENRISTWENTGNSFYSIGSSDGSVSIKLTFSQNNTQFSFGKTEVINGTTYSETTTYKKI